MAPVDIESELAMLLTALDTASDRVQRWEQQPASPGPDAGGVPGGAGFLASSGPPLSGQGAEAAEERSIRGAAAALARSDALAVREQLEAVRVRAGRVAEQARASREASQARRARGAPEAAAGGEGVGHGVARALRVAAAALAECEDAETAMTRIVTGALQVVRSARWGGLCVQDNARGRRDQVSVHAASHPIVERLEMVQASEGEGPCVAALTGTDTIYVPDLLVDRRWPHFAQVAGQLGVRSVLAVGLPVPAPGGVLNLYSPHAGGFDEPARAVVEVFAEHAAIALAGARRTGQLTRAVVSRDVIGQAKGMLMLQHGVDAERAFQMLVEASQHANLKLVDVARWMVENPDALS